MLMPPTPIIWALVTFFPSVSLFTAWAFINRGVIVSRAAVNRLIIVFILEKAKLSCYLIDYLALALACIRVKIFLYSFSWRLFGIFLVFVNAFLRHSGLQLFHAVNGPVAHALAFGLESLYAYKLFGVNVYRFTDGVAASKVDLEAWKWFVCHEQ